MRRTTRGRLARAALCAHLAHIAQMTRWQRRQPGRHDLRGRGAAALRRLISAIKPLIGEVDLTGSAAELLVEIQRLTGRRLDLSVEALRRGLRLAAGLSPLVRREGWRWYLPLRAAWLEAATDIAVCGRPRDGAAIGSAVVRWAAPPASATRPVLAEWRRRLLRPDPADAATHGARVRQRQAGDRGQVPDAYGGVRSTVDLLAAHPEAAQGKTAWRAARALLVAAGQPEDHAAIKRTARGLEYLREHGHLDAGSWRPAADLEHHLALLLGEESNDLGPPSPDMRRWLTRLGVEHPDQLSRIEARRVATRVRKLRRRAGMTEQERCAWIEMAYEDHHQIDSEFGDWLAA